MRGLVLILSMSACAEIVDRIAVTVEKSVITRSEILTQIRVAAFMDGKPVALDPASLREAADRLIQQTIIRREIALADYPAPGPDAVLTALDGLKTQRFGGNDDAYHAGLLKYGVTEAVLTEQLLWQLTLLRFVEMRFRPAVQISDEDILDYYRDRFVPEWRKNSSEPPPPPPAVRDQIEDILARERIDHALDRWLNLTRTQLPIVYREDAFREAAKP